jgi:DNA invertase Pin-like site-specific DNA recombinase
MPEANDFMLHIFAAAVQNEAKTISDRTKAVLKTFKRRDQKLSNSRWSESLAATRAMKNPLGDTGCGRNDER